MYICNLCNIYLCPGCKSKHDKKHIIIDYKDKYFICNKHNKDYNYFCEKCNKNLCELCLKEHKAHRYSEI